MKIIFFCGSAEPSNDGVGDYTRRLCGEIIRNGFDAQILALCDKQVNNCLTEIQNIEDQEVIVTRIPHSTDKKQRLSWTQEILDEFNPDWISLQFVPYSFDTKGLPFWLPKFLKKLKGTHEWNIMFHELWIGLERDSIFKNKCVGLLQKRIILKIVKCIDPKVIHTQAKIYKYYLSKIGIEANYLPLFGNVAVTASKNKNSEEIVFVVFATIHDNSPFRDFIIDLKKEMNKIDKLPKFVFIGRNGDMLDSWISILNQHRIEYEILGLSSENKISQILMSSDYGISSTPYRISDKSGVVAAMREHQLPIISVAKNWIDQDAYGISFEDIIHYQKGNLSLQKFSEVNNNDLSSVCTIFLKSIKNKLVLQ
jgi:glycosyltransferase involved in cell wall biosynthesis